jgi:tetratricopeptide (TPR) repeat protein
VEELELGRLSRAELAEQLAGILGTPALKLVEAVFARSQGNPFFAEELLAAAADGTGAGLPARLREVLLLRVAECSAAAQTMLRVVAAAGRRVQERLLAAVAPLGEAELLGGLREAVDRQLLVVPPGQDAYVFRHALVQEAVYGELLPGERARLHATLAEQLGSDEFGRTGSAAEVVVHWYRARDLPNALAWSARAAVEADGMHAYAEALGHYERVLELWDRVADPEARAGIDHVEVLRRAAEAANVINDYRRALALIGRALALIGRALREACRLAEEQGDPDTLTRAYALLGEVLMQADRLEDSVEASLSGRAPLRRLGVEGLPYDGWLLLNAAEALFKLGRWDDADPLATQSLAQARGGPGPPTIVAMLEIGRGEFEAAEAHLEAAKDRSLGGDTEEARLYCELVAELRVWQGRLEEAQAAVVTGLDRLAGTGEQRCSGRLLWLGMRVEADRAEQARARREAREIDDAVRTADALAARAVAMTPNPLAHGATPVLASGVVAAVFDGERSRLAGHPDPAGGTRRPRPGRPLAGPTRPPTPSGARPSPPPA